MTQTLHRAGIVSIVGRPNAGKSTLLNALTGAKLAIIAHQPQTTRNSIQGVLTLPDAQIVFIDTPGIHEADTPFNKRMMDTVRGALAGPDLVLFVADASRPITEQDKRAVSALTRESHVFLVLNKIDHVRDKRLLLPIIHSYVKLFPFVEAFPISARAGDGLDQLTSAVKQYLPEGAPLFSSDYLTDQPVRFLTAEIIRERILHAAREEVPHAVAVLVDTWKETSRLTTVAATIYVERPGQKAILIGNKGQMLKQIGSEAREQLERMLDTRVFISLFVKVKPKWREDPVFLNAIDWRSMLGSEESAKGADARR